MYSAVAHSRTGPSTNISAIWRFSHLSFGTKLPHYEPTLIQGKFQLMAAKGEQQPNKKTLDSNARNSYCPDALQIDTNWKGNAGNWLILDSNGT
jgi:hypothetical protein